LKSALTDPRVQFVGIADIRESAREAVKSMADKHHGNGNCVMYRDAGDLLARVEIEAVIIATSTMAPCSDMGGASGRTSTAAGAMSSRRASLAEY
jgi:hypothetical protein